MVGYPKGAVSRLPDQLVGLLEYHGGQPDSGHEVSEMERDLGRVAAEMGVGLVPDAASRQRADLQYRMIDDEHATSPVILSHRRNDDSPYLALIKALLQEMYAGAPVWLDSGKASDDG